MSYHAPKINYNILRDWWCEAPDWAQYKIVDKSGYIHWVDRRVAPDDIQYHNKYPFGRKLGGPEVLCKMVSSTTNQARFGTVEPRPERIDEPKFRVWLMAWGGKPYLGVEIKGCNFVFFQARRGEPFYPAKERIIKTEYLTSNYLCKVITNEWHSFSKNPSLDTPPHKPTKGYYLAMISGDNDVHPPAPNFWVTKVSAFAGVPSTRDISPVVVPLSAYYVSELVHIDHDIENDFLVIQNKQNIESAKRDRARINTKTKKSDAEIIVDEVAYIRKDIYERDVSDARSRPNYDRRYWRLARA